LKCFSLIAYKFSCIFNYKGTIVVVIIR
jgi:hypothetical protein